MAFESYESTGQCPDNFAENADKAAIALSNDAYQLIKDCLVNKPAVAKDAIDVNNREYLDNKGAGVAEIIARNGGFGADVDNNLRQTFNGIVARGGNLQALADAANRAFEKNKSPYYIGVGENDSLILYTNDKIQTLLLKPAGQKK